MDVGDQEIKSNARGLPPFLSLGFEKRHQVSAEADHRAFTQLTLLPVCSPTYCANPQSVPRLLCALPAPLTSFEPFYSCGRVTW